MGLLAISYGTFGHPHLWYFWPPPMPRAKPEEGFYVGLLLSPTCSLSRPSSMALTAAWVRSETSSFETMCCMCFFTVLTLIRRLRAICWLVCPLATSRSTSASRRDKACTRGARGGSSRGL